MARRATDIEDSELMRQFVESFSHWDDMTSVVDADLPVDMEAGFSEVDWQWKKWRPAAITTPSTALLAIRSRIQQEIPRLYVRLILSFRWLEVDISVCRLQGRPV